MLEDIKRDVLAGLPVGRAWDLARRVAYPNLGDGDARAALKKWARANGIKARFEPHQVGGKALYIEYVVFTTY